MGPCVLNRDGAQMTFLVELDQRVLIEVSCFNDLGGLALDIESVRILKIRDLHGRNDRSKNALCVKQSSNHRVACNGRVTREAPSTPPATKMRRIHR